MKKFFTLLMASASFLCANAASDLTFSVQAQDMNITVTPSNDTESYFAVALDEYTMNKWAMWGASADTPDLLFTLASSVYDSNIFTGAWTYNAADEGKHVVMAVAAHTADDGTIAADGDFYVETVTVGEGGSQPGDDDDPAVGGIELNFTFDSDGKTFTLTPSDLEQPYFMWVFSQEEIEYYEDINMTMEEVFFLYADGVSAEDIFVGESTQRGDEDWWLEEYGTYKVMAAPMLQEGRFYTVGGNISSFDWDYNDGTSTSIQGIAANVNAVAKAMVNGRVVLMGRYNLNGTAAK